MNALRRWNVPPTTLPPLPRFAKRGWPLFLAAAFALAGCTLPPAARGRDALATDPYAARHPDEAVRAGVPGRPAAPLHTTTYAVAQGDTLWSIAQRFQLDHWTDILDANPGVEPQRLGVGQTLRIPVPEGYSPPPVDADEEGDDEPREPAPRPLPRPPDPPTRRPPADANPRVRRGVAEARFAWPARGRVVCRFGEKIPWEPVVICRGIIIQVPSGARVSAAKSGVAFVMQSMPGLGKTVSVDHGDGTTTTYGYNSEILVRHGEFVRQGDAISVAGQAGRTDGTHVFFRIDNPQGPVDPLPLLPR